MQAARVHQPTEQCDAVHCYVHGVDEPGPFVLVCGECRHGWPTGGDLVADFNSEVVDVLNAKFGQDKPHTDDPDDIWFCPLCGHDL